MMSARQDDYLEPTRQQIVRGEICITRLLLVIARLREQGHDTAEAEHLLTEFEQSLALMREHLLILQAEHDTR